MATRLLALATVFLGAQATKKSLRPEEEAFLELDKDHSGKVEYAELEAFGKSKAGVESGAMLTFVLDHEFGVFGSLFMN
ncbi:unnamed protein product [Cladocopium goreaui]|uniref:EF-hand domain-containing protein n=1 Tax=Cladocopium goreaui TaxID=2562237 RepID=A0A9P1GQ89_9DINO|nr:unnamed protein product [Cladocopium goreaui]